MPLYEFICTQCAKVSEDIVPVGTKETKCKECGEKTMKIMSAPNFKIEGYSEANGYSESGKGKGEK